MIKSVTYRNRIDALLGITPKDVEEMKRKPPGRTKPEWKRRRRKTAHESRRRNRS